MTGEIKSKSPPYLSTFELVLLGMLAALIVAANVALRFPIKMPGHSAIVWMALLVTAAAVVPKPGAATCTAVLSGLIAVFAGVGDRGALVTLLSYASAGVGIELIVAFSRQPLGARNSAIAGLCGNLMKLGTKTLLEILVGVPPGFVVLGRLYPLITHVVFGVIGGYLGFLVVSALRRAGYFAYLAQRH